MKKIRLIMLAMIVVGITVGMVFAGDSNGCVLVLTQKGGSAALVNISSDGVTSDEKTSIVFFDWASILNQYLGFTASGAAKTISASKEYIGGAVSAVGIEDVSKVNLSAKPKSGKPFVIARGRRGGCVANPVQAGDFSGSNVFVMMGSREGQVGGGGTKSEFYENNPPCNFASLANTLPVLCPQMASARHLYGDNSISEDVLKDPAKDYFNALWGAGNKPGATAGAPAFNCANALHINQVTARYDWEDSALLLGTSTEGDENPELFGGDYSRFRFVAMPFKPLYEEKYATFLKVIPATTPAKAGDHAIKASELMKCASSDDKVAEKWKNPCTPDEQAAFEAWQYLIHLGQDEQKKGLAANGYGEDPPFRLLNTLPGAFWTVNDDGYWDCEWLDTKYQAPVQTLSYKNLPVWDWNMSACVAIIVLEGDSSQAEKFGWPMGMYSTKVDSDDLVGFFKVCKDSPEASGKMIQNYSKDMDIVFGSGPVQCK